MTKPLLRGLIFTLLEGRRSLGMAVLLRDLTCLGGEGQRLLGQFELLGSSSREEAQGAAEGAVGICGGMAVPGWSLIPFCPWPPILSATYWQLLLGL